MRGKLRLRYLLPAGVVVAVALGGILMTVTAGASASRAADGAQTVADLPAPSIHYVRKFTSSQVHEGEVLFEQTCSACHGPQAAGTALAPDLQGVGPATVDFWVSTGRMPLASSAAEATIKPSRFSAKQTLAIAAFVASLAPTSPNYPDGVPVVDTKNANLALGDRLFVLNCAACHTITGAGDALANGAYAPTLHLATTTQVAEAIRTGPGEMPVFGPGELSNKQVADIVAYVTGPIQHPENPGGIGLGGVGPVAEGLVALLVGVGALMLVAFWLGERA
ncbi:MAG: c-type cytochrome [Actinomycetota bacterium]|nr:c-type cytochrome [Actinomycetota bacterium]